MKKHAAALLAILAFPGALAATTAVNPIITHGAAASARVRYLISKNPHLREALERMRQRGLEPKVDSATIVTATAIPTPQARTSSVGASDTVSGDGVELVFIASYEGDKYWEGTLDACLYDSSGNLEQEYIANAAGSMPDPSSFVIPWEDPVYSFDRSPQTYSIELPRGERERDRDQRPSIATGGGGGKMGAWVRCSLTWCAGAAAGCFVGNIIDGEMAWGPCTAVGCIGGAIGCTFGTLFN